MFLLLNFINIWNRVITAERVTREHLLRGVSYRGSGLTPWPAEQQALKCDFRESLKWKP